MYTRHEEVPVFEHRVGTVNADHYNHAQLALKRLGDEIRLAIPGLKHLDLILQKDAWVIVDRVLNDIPIAAWSDFETAGRDSMHKPIKCRIRLYHAYAGMILKRTLEAMDRLLCEELAAQVQDEGSSVIPFKKPD